MDQLYEAAPIPPVSDDDDEWGHHGHHLPNRSSTASGLDVSAHSSPSNSSSFSTLSEDDDSDGENADADDGAALHDAHRHRVFTTTSSPDDLYTFLVELLQLAEQLHVRLCNAVPEESPAPPQLGLTDPSLTEPSQPLQTGNCHSGGSIKGKEPHLRANAGEDRRSATSTAALQQGRSNVSLLNSTPHHAFISAASCHGIAKLRGRLCKETENLRKAVNGLREAGCVNISHHRRSMGGTAAEATTGIANRTLEISSAFFSAAVSCAQCNSISHFEGVVTCLERERGVTGIYVPMSGYVGPPSQYSTAPPSVSALLSTAAADDTHGTRGVAGSKSTFTDDVRIEVDVVSAGGHRWIKVKTATARNMALEAAALELNGGTPFTDMLLALCARSRRACLPHRRVAHVAVVLLHPPPPPLQTFLEVHRIAWVALTAKPSRAPRGATDLGTFLSTVENGVASPWLPSLTFAPAFVCLDTTALVTLCSQSCYADGMPMEVRLARLSPYHVLQEQQRKEAVECTAVDAVMEPALRVRTQWCTQEEMNERMRCAMLREDEARSEDTQQQRECASYSREAHVPAWLIHEVDLSWLPALQQAAQERPSNASDGDCYAHPRHALQESKLLRELSDRQEHDSTRRPNWIIADVTYEEFRWILETIAGPDEVARATRLLRLVTVVNTNFLRERMRVERGSSTTTTGSTQTPAARIVAEPTEAAKGNGASNTNDGAAQDCVEVPLKSPPSAAAHPSPPPSPAPLFTSVEYLRLSGKVSLRNKIVFGLADAVDAVIVTSNEQLCHAAREQGICVEACFHPSRSLTEQKIYQLCRRHGPGKPPAVL
jgi:hypothetical protein